MASQRRAVRAHSSRTSMIKRSRVFDVFERSDRPETSESEKAETMKAERTE